MHVDGQSAQGEAKFWMEPALKRVRPNPSFERTAYGSR